MLVCVHEGGTTVCWYVCMSEVPLAVGVCMHAGGVTVCWYVCMRKVPLCVGVCA